MKRALAHRGNKFLFVILVVFIALIGPVTIQSQDAEYIPEVQEQKAPWNLTGDMYLIMMYPQKQLINEKGFVPKYMENRYVGGMTLLVLAKYKTSNVGPYNELMFIPGKFNFKSHPYNTITKIYVSTWDSVINGTKNWGIPKERADIDFYQEDSKTEELVVTKDNKEVASIKLKTVNNKYTPFDNGIFWGYIKRQAQHHDNKTYIYYPQIKANMTLAKVVEMKADKNYFPELDTKQVILAFKFKDVNMVFPVSTILDGID